MMKVIGGQSIATDNTCKTYKELQSFFEKAPGELDNVISLYELFDADASKQESITNVLTQLKDYREILNEVKNKQSSSQVMAADDYQVVIPKGLYEMVLDSRTNPDNFLKSTQPIFAVAHNRIGDTIQKTSILGHELRAAFSTINAADINTTGPTVEGYKNKVTELVEDGALALPMSEPEKTTLDNLEKVWQDLGYPQASWDETAKGALEERIKLIQGMQVPGDPDEAYDADQLLGVLDDVAQVIFQGKASNNFKTFAAEICSKNDYGNDTKTDKLSVLTQFFLATTNIYLHDKDE